MINLFIQDRNCDQFNDSRLPKYLVKADLAGLNFCIYLTTSSTSLQKLTLSNFDILISACSDIHNIKHNLKIIDRLLDDGLKLGDITFILPSIMGYADSILSSGCQYLIVPGLNTKFNLYTKLLERDTLPQKRLHIFMKSLFGQSAVLLSWNLIPKATILWSTLEQVTIRRFPRFYSDISDPSFFDQRLKDWRPKDCLNAQNVKKILVLYFREKYSHCKLQEPFFVPQRYFGGTSFSEKCHKLKEWLLMCQNNHPADVEEIILYLLLTSPEFNHRLMDLFLVSLQGLATVPSFSESIRSPILHDWHMQCLASILAPFLTPIIISIVSPYLMLPISSNFSAEVLIAQMVAR